MSLCDSNRTPSVNNDNCSASSGLPLGTDSGLALSCNASVFDKLINGSQYVRNRVGTMLKPVSLFEANQFKTPYDFEAAGNGIDDDSDAMQRFADYKCEKILSPGVYKITRPILFTSLTTLVGNNPGVGTGFWDSTGNNNAETYLNSQISQASQGASIIYADSSFSGEALLIFEDPININLSSAIINNLKVTCNIYDYPEAHGIKIVGAYDVQYIGNVNVIGCGDGSNAIRQERTQSGRLSQTVLWDNVVCIHGVTNAATAPTIYQDYVQEGVFNSVKAFGSFFNNDDYSSNDCWYIQDGRGCVYNGCSTAITHGNGWRLRNESRSTVYHQFEGCTTERVTDGWNIDGKVFEAGETRTELSRIYINNARPAFPTENLLKAQWCSAVFCDSGSAKVILNDEVRQSSIETSSLSLVTNNSGNNSNLVTQLPDSIEGRYKIANDVDIVKNSPSLRLATIDGIIARIVHSANEGGASNGLIMQLPSGNSAQLTDEANLILNSSVQSGLTLKDENLGNRRFTIDSDNTMRVNGAAVSAGKIFKVYHAIPNGTQTVSVGFGGTVSNLGRSAVMLGGIEYSGGDLQSSIVELELISTSLVKITRGGSIGNIAIRLTVIEL